MSVIAATTVLRGSQPGASHGGVYLVDLDGQRGAHLLDWTRPSIDCASRPMPMKGSRAVVNMGVRDDVEPVSSAPPRPGNDARA